MCTQLLWALWEIIFLLLLYHSNDKGLHTEKGKIIKKKGINLLKGRVSLKHTKTPMPKGPQIKQKDVIFYNRNDGRGGNRGQHHAITWRNSLKLREGNVYHLPHEASVLLLPPEMSSSSIFCLTDASLPYFLCGLFMSITTRIRLFKPELSRAAQRFALADNKEEKARSSVVNKEWNSKKKKKRMELKNCTDLSRIRTLST